MFNDYYLFGNIKIPTLVRCCFKNMRWFTLFVLI